jgi:cytochrome c556
MKAEFFGFLWHAQGFFTLVVCAVFMGLGAGHARATEGSLQKTLRDLEDTAQQLYHFERLREEGDGASEEVREFNQWLEAEQQKLTAAQKELQKESLKLEELLRDIKMRDAALEAFSPSRRDEKALREHNQKVSARNELVRAYGAQAEGFNQRQMAFNERSEVFRSEANRRRAVVQQRQDAVRQKAEALRAWQSSDQDRAYWDAVNRFWLVLEDARNLPADLREELTTRYYNLRRLLGEYARRKQKEAEFGLVIVRARFGGSLEGHFMVDTGASYVTLTEALAKALNAVPAGGELLELDIAGGHRISGPLVEIPVMEIVGQRLEKVPAVVIPSGSLGVDGLLGHSFLGAFILTLDKGSEKPLHLKPREKL